MGHIKYQRHVKAAPHVAGIATPTNTVLPVITGDVAGETSTTSDGTWDDADTFLYQWYLDGEALAGETSDSIDTSEDWVGQTLSVTVTGCNGAGCIVATAEGVVLTEGSEYTGPLDLVPGAIVALGSRALTSAWLGQNIFRLRRDSDDAEQNFAADATTGEAPAAAIAAFIGAGDGFLVTMYDQSGNGYDFSEATAAAQPLYTANLSGGKPGFTTHGGSLVEGPTTIPFPNGACSFIALTNTDNTQFQGNTNDGGYCNVNIIDGGDRLFQLSDADGSNYAQGVYTPSATGLKVVDCGFQIGTRSYYINGVAQTVADGDSGTLTGITLDSDTSVRTSGGFAEMLLYNTLKSPADRQPGRENMMTFYGIS